MTNKASEVLKLKLANHSNAQDSLIDPIHEENGHDTPTKSWLKPTSAFSIRTEKIKLSKSPRSADVAITESSNQKYVLLPKFASRYKNLKF